MVYTETVKAKIKSNDFFNITGKVEDIVRKSKIESGICNVFAIGSTTGLIINEDEPMLLEDLRNSLEIIANSKKIYQHAENAFSHIKSMFLGNSTSIPVKNGKLVLGTWQEIMIVNLDTEDREREVVITIMGE